MLKRGDIGNYYYGARYYGPRVSVWLSVDPLASDFPSWTPYHFVHNNPLNLIDPTGMYATGPEGKEEGTDIAGLSTVEPNMLGEVTITAVGRQSWSSETDGSESAGISLAQWNEQYGEAYREWNQMSEHEQNMSNPLGQEMRQAQSAFIESSVDITADVLNSTGYAASFVPGLQPLAGGLIAASGALSGTASVIKAMNDFENGNNKRAAANLANAGLSFALGRQARKAAETAQGANILNAGINIKSGIADRVINRK